MRLYIAILFVLFIQLVPFLIILDKKDPLPFHDMYEALVSDAEIWARLGNQLGLESTVDNAKADLKDHHDVKQFLEDMLKIWLHGKNPKPQDLVDALKSKVVGESTLALKLEEKYKLRSATYNSYCVGVSLH